MGVRSRPSNATTQRPSARLNDPEEWHRILERFFAILTDGVHRFQGTVNQ
jgi:hypothetical protein